MSTCASQISAWVPRSRRGILDSGCRVSDSGPVDRLGFYVSVYGCLGRVDVHDFIQNMQQMEFPNVSKIKCAFADLHRLHGCQHTCVYRGLGTVCRDVPSCVCVQK